MKYLIVCVGNRDGGDDAVGPFIADLLKQRELKEIEVLDVGTCLENYTGLIKEKQPDILVIIDAVEMQLKPGEIRIISPDDIGVMHVSTHGIPLSVFIKYFSQYGYDIILIGIQPKTMRGTMTDIVKHSAHKLCDMILSDKMVTISELNT